MGRLVAAGTVDPAERVDLPRRDRNRGTALRPDRRPPTLHGRFHEQVQPAVLHRLQTGIRDIAIDELLLVLLRAVGGDGQVAEIDMERRRADQRRIDFAARSPAGRRVSAAFSGPLVAMSPVSGIVIVKLAESGSLIPSIAQRSPSSGRTEAVTAASPVGSSRPGIGHAMR